MNTWSERTEACFGSITDDDTGGVTALEEVLGRGAFDTIPRCNSELRGYSWITLCAEQLVERLGGVESLSRSGAFHSVARLAHGAVFLQATPTLADYDDAAIRRVFEALAPVLLTG